MKTKVTKNYIRRMVREELERKKNLIVFQRKDWQKIVDDVQLVGDLADKWDLGTPIQEIIHWNVQDLLSDWMLGKQFATDRFGRRYYMNNISPDIDVKVQKDPTGDTIGQGQVVIRFDFDFEDEPGGE